MKKIQEKINRIKFWSKQEMLVLREFTTHVHHF
jgi:hypothetical protein